MKSNLIQDSVITEDGATYAMTTGRQLLVEGDMTGFEGALSDNQMLCDLTAANAAALRGRLSWLKPVPLGLQKSFGFGDRLGLATPGHIQALRTADRHHTVAPIFAQQSVRENNRVGRTPQQVMDDAMWGVFRAGWRLPWGADADHVKEITHISPFVSAGYTFYTIDPSDHVDNEAQTDDLETLQAKTAALPWDVLQTDYSDAQQRYVQQPVVLDGLTLSFDAEILLRALAKYGRAIAHTATIAQELARQIGGKPFELEMSVDETDTPTSAYEHFYIVNELQRLGVPVVSVAPRFVGKFQKGVDYMGDRAEFAAELAKHTAIMHHFGRYKMSVHTGSDKFSIYEEINRQANGRVHVKTAGTSYLEALRVISKTDTPLFRQILDLAHERFEKDRKTYFLDCQPERVPTSSQLSDMELPALLDDFDARQLLHVTFGSALDKYGPALKANLLEDEAAYEAVLVAHFGRHLRPFC